MLIFADVILGIILLAIGLIFKKFPPQEINNMVGYRTERSMKSQNAWEEANRYCAVYFIRTGYICIAVGVVCGLFFDQAGIMISIGTALGLIAYCIYKTEKHIKDLFDENGDRKNSLF